MCEKETWEWVRGETETRTGNGGGKEEKRVIMSWTSKSREITNLTIINAKGRCLNTVVSRSAVSGSAV